MYPNATNMALPILYCCRYYTDFEYSCLSFSEASHSSFRCCLQEAARTFLSPRINAHSIQEMNFVKKRFPFLVLYFLIYA